MVAGIVLFVLGIVVAVTGIIGWVVGGLGTGGALCALGVLFFAFSFIRLPHVPDAPPPMSPVQRLTGIFFEPSNVFRNLRSNPEWLVALLIVGILSAAYVVVFTRRVTPERIVNFTADKMAEVSWIPPEAVEKTRTEGLEQAKSPSFQAGTFVRRVVGAYFVGALLAALYLVGVLAFGGRMHYWQSLSVVAYAAVPVTIISRLISFIVLFVKSPEDVHPLIGQEGLVYDNLGLLLSAKEHPVFWVIATSIGVLAFYRLWLTATGLREGGYKVSKTTGWAVAVVFWVLGLLFGVASAAIFPSFLGD
jgi:Yip1-like protein